MREIFRSLRALPTWHALRTHYLAQLDWSSSRSLRRSESFGAAVPWWSYSCTDFLQQVVSADATVLEFGAGASTEWWLSRGNRVTSLESASAWAELVRERCANFSDRLELSIVDFESKDVGRVLTTRFDIVVIDNEGARGSLIPLALRHVQPEGIIVFDNADRAEYASAIASLADDGYRRLDFFGLGPINAYASLTSIFVRGSIDLNGSPSRFATVTY